MRVFLTLCAGLDRIGVRFRVMTAGVLIKIRRNSPALSASHGLSAVGCRYNPAKRKSPN